MSNRFHNKYHRHNHHTYGTAGEADSKRDPIASREDPFLGDFVLAGALSAVAPASGYAGYFYTNANGATTLIGLGDGTNSIGVYASGTNIGLLTKSVTGELGDINIDEFGNTNVVFPRFSSGFLAAKADGNALVTKALSAGSVWTDAIYATSAVLLVTDMHISELSGFTIKDGDWRLGVPTSIDPATEPMLFLQGIGLSATSWAANNGDYVIGRGLSAQELHSGPINLGFHSVASGNISYTEGYQTSATGNYSHAEGEANIASNRASHAEGRANTASGFYSHVEGFQNQSTNTGSHAEGLSTTASGDGSHAEGGSTTASGIQSHAEGGVSVASNTYSHAEGMLTTASGHSSHAEGYNFGSGITASGRGAHAEGYTTGGSVIIASGNGAHAEGSGTTASGDYSHAEGESTTASNQSAHAEGAGTTASGLATHAEGRTVIASGDYSHAEGDSTKSSGGGAHSEGLSTRAEGDYSHAAGRKAVAGYDRSYVWSSYNTEVSSRATDQYLVSAENCVILGNCLNVEGPATFSLGGVTINENLYVSGDAAFSGDVDFTGDVTLSSLHVTYSFTSPSGSTGQRPTPTIGNIYFNSTLSAFEGYNGSAWASLGGLIDVDRDTYIIAETSTGADNDQLQHYTAGQLALETQPDQSTDFHGVVTTLSGFVMEVRDSTPASLTTGRMWLSSSGVVPITSLSGFEINSDLFINGSLTVSQSASFAGKVDFNCQTAEDIATIDSVDCGGLTVIGDTTFISAVDIDSTLNVDGDTTLSTLTAGATKFTSSVNTQGLLTVDGLMTAGSLVRMLSGSRFDTSLTFGETLTSTPTQPATAANVFLECTVAGISGFGIPLYYLP